MNGMGYLWKGEKMKVTRIYEEIMQSFVSGDQEKCCFGLNGKVGKRRGQVSAFWYEMVPKSEMSQLFRQGRS